jgi:hypothetical protein
VSVSTTIDRARQDVYALLSDLSAHRRWTDHFLVDWEELGPDRVRVRAKGAGPSPPAEIHTTESTPDRVAEESVAGKRRMTGVYELRDNASGGTDVTFTNEVLERGNALEALFDPFVRRYLRKNNTEALARLKSILES